MRSSAADSAETLGWATAEAGCADRRGRPASRAVDSHPAAGLRQATGSSTRC